MSALVALAAALLPLEWLLAAVGLTLALALPLFDPVFGLYLLVLSVPVQDLLTLPGGASYTQAAALLALGAWSLRILARRQQEIAAGPLLPLWAGLLWALLLASAFTPFSTTEAIKATLRWAIAFLAWLLAINTANRPWQIAGLIACLLLAPAADAAIGVWQFFSGSGPPSFRIAAPAPYVRAYGTIGQPNSFAGYLNMAWPLGLALAAGATGQLLRRPTWRWWALVAALWLSAGLLVAGLLLSFSLGGWIGAAAGALGLALAAGRWWARAATAVALAGVGALAAGGARLLPGPVAARLTRVTDNLALFDPSTVAVTPDNFAVVERMAQMYAGWRMALTHPLTGVGPGNYTAAYAEVASAPWYASRGHAHNFYLHIAAEAGAIGLLAYGALIGGVTIMAIAALRRVRGRFGRSVIIGCCGIIAAVAGHNLFENLHVLHLSIQLGAVWALVTAVSRDERPFEAPA